MWIFLGINILLSDPYCVLRLLRQKLKSHTCNNYVFRPLLRYQTDRRINKKWRDNNNAKNVTGGRNCMSLRVITNGTKLELIIFELSWMGRIKIYPGQGKIDLSKVKMITVKRSLDYQTTTMSMTPFQSDFILTVDFLSYL